MATNGTNIAVESALGEEIFGIHIDHGKTLAGKRARDNRGIEAGETITDLTLAPLVDAYGIARVLAEAVKELDNHISTETRKVGDTVGRQLNTLQTSVQELYGFLKEQRSTNLAVQEQLQRLTATAAETDARQARELEALRTLVRESSESGKQRMDSLTDSLKESDARQSSELAALRTQTAEQVGSLRADVSVQQEDIAAVKAELGALNSRIDALADRLHRQGDALRLMQTTYSQRETELEQLVDGLARLRAFPKPQPADEF